MSSYELAIRNQFRFCADDDTLACILTANVAKDSPIKVNVVTMVIEKIDMNTNSVKIVVGTDDPNDQRRGGGPVSNKEQNRQFRKILKKFDIDYTEQLVIQIFNLASDTGIPGSYRIPYVALICAGINVTTVYVGEPVLKPNLRPSNVQTFFIEVPEQQIKRAIKVLSRINLDNPDSQLCINRKNVFDVSQILQRG